MIGILDVEIAAKCPNIPLHPLYAFVNSPSSLHIHNVPKKIGSWQITSVSFQVTYPDDSTRAVACVNVGDTWIGTVQGTATPGTSTFGYTIYASGVDENGNDVTGYVLGKGDVEILDNDGHVTPGEHMTYMKLFEGQPQTPNEGDMWESDGSFYVWLSGAPQLVGDDSGAINELSAKVVDLSGHVHEGYIQDADGNAISANRQVTYQGTLPTPYWHISLDGGAIECDMTGPKTNSAYVKLPHENGDTGFYLQFADERWTLTQVTWTWDEAEQEWTQFTDMTFTAVGSADDTELSFGDGYVSVTWTTTGQMSDVLATQGWTSAQISAVVGDINSVLDAINGEVI